MRLNLIRDGTESLVRIADRYRRRAVGRTAESLAREALVGCPVDRNDVFIGWLDRQRFLGYRPAARVEHDQVGRAKAAAGDYQRLLILNGRIGDAGIADNDDIGGSRYMHDLGVVDGHR